MHSGKFLEKTKMVICIVFRGKCFPKQTDGSSCGIYVCAVARAIVFNSRLPDEPNLLFGKYLHLKFYRVLYWKL